MRNYWQKGYHFVREKIPFAATGFVATGINYGLYLFLVDRYLPYMPATLVAYSSSVVLNFFMQRYFVFELRRSLHSAFLLSMLVSLGGLFLDAAIVWILHTDWVAQWTEQFILATSPDGFVGARGSHVLPKSNEWIIKGIATILVFFYNFYLKRFVFEGSFSKPSLQKDESSSIVPFL